MRTFANYALHHLKPSTVRALFLAIAAALLGALAAHLWLAPPDVVLQTGTLLPEAREIGDFELTGEDGRPFTAADLKGRWSILFTGFTHCPDVCPTTLATLKNVAGRLNDDDKLQVVFLSVDPERDSPEALATYVHYFSPRFRAATGPTSELDRLGAKLGFVYVKVPGRTPETYTMDHSAALILVNPAGRLAGYFTPPLRAEMLAGDLASLLKAGS